MMRHVFPVHYVLILGFASTECGESRFSGIEEQSHNASPLEGLSEPHIFKFTTELPFTSSLRNMTEAKGMVKWEFSNFSKTSTLRRLTNVVSPEEADSILGLLPDKFSSAADTVDLLPSHEYYIENHVHNTQSAPAPLLNLTHHIIEQRLLPYISEAYTCPHCHACVSLVRRYQPNERMAHPAHYDRQAYITALVSLSSHGKDFTGGFYVRTFPGTEQIVTSQVGDVLFHQSDLEHGVNVQKGVRYSWIIWFQDSHECKSHGNADWFIPAAQRGDPVAMFNLGSLLVEGKQTPNAKTEEVSSQAFMYAAATGYPRAEFKLGNAYYFGKGVTQNYTAARQWYEKAANQNLSVAAYNLARMYANGLGGKSDALGAVKWYRQSLANPMDRQSAAYNNLANILYHGAEGVEPDEAEALNLWTQGARDGVAQAALNLADVFVSKADYWRARYAELTDSVHWSGDGGAIH
eukprot:gnl/MRDRNA2_/MRDRNA2_54633_c0_seq1.p1 gnl/MRDRNA2_/MRDRNA2_54633_c0~~gnl/MRDRNA2_/MRDRNA2_54633_c0_seq1.p1  ORF type:complete len:464 (+),score=57.74 gnl/MRDRNA2_/MRDRNA2_54633_c0_seq1:148-1539(+)